MTFSYLQNGIHYATIHGDRFENIIPVITLPEYKCGRIIFKIFTTCPYDKSLYITLWDEFNSIHQFIFYDTANTLEKDFLHSFENIVNNINDKLSEKK